jgi:HTH-type transcriptional regulator/antitoxin HigA
MPTKITTRIAGKARDAYLRLVREYPLTSIRSEEQLRGAQNVMDRLLAKGELNDGEFAYLDALSDLVAVYEDVHYRLPAASDAEMLRHLLESRGITQAELCRAIKIVPSVISEILSGKRGFSKDLVGKLARYFNVDKSVLAGNF